MRNTEAESKLSPVARYRRFPWSTLPCWLATLASHVDLSASVYNLLDKKYFDPPSTDNLQQEIQQDGRSFRVKMTWHWGGR